MKDYDLKIIDYRGGKALLIDSLDLIQVTSDKEREKLKEKIEAVYRTVDYVLLLSSMTPDRIHPYFRFFFNNRDVIFCYRHITHKGETMIKKLRARALQKEKQIIDETPEPEEVDLDSILYNSIKKRQKKEIHSLREQLEKLGDERE